MRVTRPASGLLAKGVPLSTFAQRLTTTDTCGTLKWLHGAEHIGRGAPTWALDFHEGAEIDCMSQLTLANDYLEGRITATGSQRDILPLRHHLPYGLTAGIAARSLAEFPLALVARHRRELIEAHYDRPDDFFLSFLDQRHHLYTQGHFASPSDDLEAASERKLNRIRHEFRKIGAKRILDVGCGWGGVTCFLAHEFDVTALTLGRKSYDFTRDRLERQGLSARVHLCDVLNYRDQEPYDGVVILGVLEHVPQYHRLFAHLAELTHARSRLYIDCSSSYSRLAMNPFIRQRIWPGTHGFVDLPAMLTQARRGGFHVVEVADETSDYAATMGIWADRFAAHQEAIVELVGQADYRAFEMYLFGGEESLLTRRLEAYHCILGRSGERGGE